MFTSIVFKWLDVSLDYGISENDFWSMTIAELVRAVNSKKRTTLEQARERAAYDYILADLIGRSIARIYDSANNLPSIHEAYPSLYSQEEVEEKKQEKQAELSALRFRQFANSYNKKYKEVANKE